MKPSRAVRRIALLVILLFGTSVQAASLAGAQAGSPGDSRTESTIGSGRQNRFVASLEEAFGTAKEASAASSVAKSAPAEGPLTQAAGVAAARGRPVITVGRSNTTPYNGVIPVRITLNGAPVYGPVTVGVSVSIGGDSWSDIDDLLVENGEAFYTYLFDEDALGESVTMTFFVVEDSQYLASSTTPRLYTLTDLPRPVLTFAPGRFISKTGTFEVGVSVPEVPMEFPVYFSLSLNGAAPGVLVALTENGTASYHYNYSAFPGATVAAEVGIYETEFTKPVSLRRTASVSAGAPNGYALPAGSALKRSGSLFIRPSGHMSSAGVYWLTVQVDGRTLVFPGRWQTRGGPWATGVYFDYQLPQSTVGKKARVVASHEANSFFLAGSSSPRNYEIIK